MLPGLSFISVRIRITTDSQETIKWSAQGIGRLIGSGKTSFRVSMFFSTSSTEKLSSLNNAVSVFEHEIDEAGNTASKVWEWK